MADGGIVGFKEGAPILGDRPTPQGQPKMGSVSPKAVDSAQIKQFAELYKDLETSIANATDPKEKSTLENALRDLITQMQTTKQLPYVMQYIDSTQGVVQPRTQMADGGIVALREGGGIGETLSDLLTLATRTPFTPEGERSNFGKLLAAIPRGLMGLLRGDYKGKTSREADKFNREVMQALNERNIGGTETPEPEGIEGLMAMVRPVDEPTTPPETMYVPSRAEQFSQMFPDVRKAVNESEGTEMGGIKYLQMIGEMQAKAKEDEARRALNYIKMMADNRGMIDAADPAVNIPTFENGGGVGQAYLDPETGEPLGGLDRVKRLFQGLTGQLTAEDLYQNPDAMTPQELLKYPSEAEIRRARYDVPEEERLSPQELNAMTREEGRERLINRALERREEQTPEKTGGTMPDVFDVASMVENLGKPQEESEEFRMKGVTDAGKQEEPVARRGLAGLLDKIEKNADMNRLRAFLRGGAGQTSVANALAAADRGLAAEDLRQRQLDIQEKDILGRIAASRYGSELDYRAALANLRQDEREMIYKADRELEKQYLGAEQDAAKTFLSNLDDSELFSSQFMRLQQEFEGAQLAAETAALRERLLDDYMNSYRRSGLGVSTGTFGYTAPSE
tara:strand:- start:572 stop:2443 length:1872 start_codon:yes stop_codon:yes gene_type:complete